MNVGWLLMLIGALPLALLFMAVASFGPSQADPISDEVELEMLMRAGMTEEEAKAFQADLNDWISHAKTRA